MCATGAFSDDKPDGSQDRQLEEFFKQAPPLITRLSLGCFSGYPFEPIVGVIITSSPDHHLSKTEVDAKRPAVDDHDVGRGGGRPQREKRHGSLNICVYSVNYVIDQNSENHSLLRSSNRRATCNPA